ncbi:MAG TPA: TetR/AcrR family transcriptional regulator [Stenomitos sp.]
MFELPMLSTPSEAPVERADAAENRRRILAAARELVREQGACAVSMDDVARKAGVGKGTLYRRFADKATLMVALLDEEARAMQADVMRVFAQSGQTPRLRLLADFLDRVAEFTLANATTLEVSSRQGAGRFEAPYYRWQHELVVRLLREAIARGECPDQDAELLADAILIALDPALLALQLRRGKSAVAIRRTYLRWVLGGIQKPFQPA